MTHLSRTRSSICGALVVLATISIIVLPVQNRVRAQTRNQKAAEEEPIFHEYRGVQIGWLADDVRKKLGSPADKGVEQDFYMFGEKETAQILYDKSTQKVVTISVDFMNGATGIPTPQQVFGGDIESKPDGSKYKIVRYPKVGYWLSYSRTGGDTPIVTVTLQKM